MAQILPLLMSRFNPTRTRSINSQSKRGTLIATGHSNKEIAEQLYITKRTVKNHVNSILRSLDLRDRTQTAIFAHKYLD